MRFPVAVGVLTHSLTGMSTVVLGSRAGPRPHPPTSILRRPTNKQKKENGHDPSPPTGRNVINNSSRRHEENIGSDEFIKGVVRSRRWPSLSKLLRDQVASDNRYHGTDTTVEKECDPTQIENADEDIVGILSCGMGEYCMESVESGLGGYCRQSSSRRLFDLYGNAVHDGRRVKVKASPAYFLDRNAKNIENADGDSSADYSNYQVFCNSSSDSFAPSNYAISCDCSGFDPLLVNGNIVCTTDITCQTYSNESVCANFTYTFEYVSEPYDFTATVCASTVDQEVCIAYDYYPLETCIMYHNGRRCQACAMTNGTYCIDFDCNNVVVGVHAGSTCDANQAIFQVKEDLVETNEITCLRMLEPLKNNLDGYDCGCSTVLDVDGSSAGNPQFALDCTLKCESCDETRQICGAVSRQYLITQGRDSIKLKQSYQYTAGRENKFVVTKNCSADESLSVTCNTCNVRVDDTRCNSCEIVICDESKPLPTVKYDCGNIEEGAVLDPCISQEFSNGQLLFGPTLDLQQCAPPSDFENTINSIDYTICADSGTLFLVDGPTIVGEVLQTALSSEMTIPSCTSSTFDSLYSGAWLSVVGNGQNVTATTCSLETNFDTAISVYEGPSCDQLRCISSNGGEICRASTRTLGSLTSSVSWLAEEGVIYRVRVHGMNLSFGQFGLSITGNPIGVRPENRVCSGSSKLEVGVKQSGSLSAADTISQEIACSGSQISAIGGWYEVVGNGNVYTVSSCLSETDIGTQILVYKGGCRNLVCERQLYQIPVCGDNVFIDSAASSASWVSVPGEVYNVMVAGANITEWQGTYELTLAEQPKATNTRCSSADMSLAVGFPPVVGNTLTGENATICTRRGSAVGIWYLVNTTTEGGVLTASTCSESETNFQTELSVFRGSCESLECIAEAATASACERGLEGAVQIRGSKVSWSARSQETYYIFVHGEAFATSNFVGDFILSLSEVEGANEQIPSVDNDSCDTAEGGLKPDGPPYTGSTILATNDFSPESVCGVSLNSTGLWYGPVAGADVGLSASTCRGNDTTARISVFEGECDALTCVDGTRGNDPVCDFAGTTVNWFAVAGEQYYIFVHGDSQEEFVLSLTRLGVSMRNSFCSQATELSMDETTSGSTTDAIQGTTLGEYCGVSIDKPGVWYSLNGTDEEIRISGCTIEGVDNYEVSVSVFTGSCGDLICVDGQSFGQFCSDGIENEMQLLQVDDGSLTWFGESAATYFVLVHGQGPTLGDGGVGSFEINVERGPLTGAPTVPAPSPSPEEDSGGPTEGPTGNEDESNSPVTGNEDESDSPVATDSDTSSPSAGPEASKQVEKATESPISSEAAHLVRFSAAFHVAAGALSLSITFLCL